MKYEKFPIPENDFLLFRRSPLLSYPTYSQQLSFYVEVFDVHHESPPEDLLDSPNDAQGLAALSGSMGGRAADTISYIHIQYSAGVSIEDVRNFFPEALQYWEEYAKYHEAFHATPGLTHKVPHLDLHDDDYWLAVRLATFAILLGCSKLLPRIVALWDYENDDMDGLLEHLVAPFVSGRGAPPDECTRHLPYFKLLKVFSAEPDNRPALMAKYMDDWYEASRREPYYKSHTKGREHNFLGYWSFEAAAVTYVLDIDDSSYRDHEFYPRDLIDFARSLPRPSEIGGEAAQMKFRCEANNPCPKTGYWFTPAKLGSRRYFQQGEIMPDFPASTYGITIWMWDQHQD